MYPVFKKYAALTLTAALLGAAGAGVLTVNAYDAVSDINVETEDVPQSDSKVSAESPFAGVNNISKLPKAGDADGDSKVTAADSLIILRAAVGLKDNNIDRYYAGDVDADNNLTSADSLHILRKTVGIGEEFDNEQLDDINWYKDSKHYYAEYKNGEPVIGIAVTDGYKCAFDDLGRLLTGKTVIDGKTYNITDEGIILEGWQNDANGRSYYADGVKLNGWKNIYGFRYYFDNGIAAEGWKKLDGKKMYFDSDNTLTRGFKTIDGKLYYFGSDYSMQVGLTNVSGKKYFFRNSGGFFTGWKTVDGKRYYFTDSGEAALGFTEINGKTLYFIDETTQAEGLYTVDGKVYFFNDNNIMMHGWKYVGDKKYYFGEDGSAAVGEVIIDGEKYCFEENGGFKVAFHTIDGKTYYNDKHGYKVHGWQYIGNISLGRVKYYFDSNGAMATGVYDIDGIKFNFDSNGALQDGWVENNGFKSYVANSELVKGIYRIRSKNYNFGKDGVLRTGIFEKDGSYFCNNEYGYPQKGWQTSGSDKFYFNADGTGADGFLTVDGSLYCFEKGRMLTNTTVKLYSIDGNGICTKITTVTGPLAKYKAEEIVQSVGTDPSDLCMYVIDHMTYYYVNVPLMYTDPYNADWRSVAAHAMNKGYGACYHYSSYVDQLFHAAGYQSRVVVGTGYGTVLHSWNQVYLDGQWKNFDCGTKFFGVSTEYLQSVNWTFDNIVYPEY